MAEESTQPAHKRHDLQTTADLERVTDYAEEKEISADIESVSFTEQVRISVLGHTKSVPRVSSFFFAMRFVDLFLGSERR